MKWFCSIKPPPQDPYVVILETEDAPTLAETVIEADIAYDARKFACVILGRMARASTDVVGDPTLIICRTGDDAVADYTLRWVGTDADQVPNRRIQVRKKGEKKWREWDPAEPTKGP